MNNDQTVLGQRLTKRESEAREWVRDQLLAWAESECPAIKARKVWEPWFVAMLAHHRFGTKPTWAHDSRDNCDTCGIAMEWQECELSADPDDGRVGYRSVCPCCGKGEDEHPRTKREIAEDAA